MSIYYFETEKQNLKNFPSNKKYICIRKPVKPEPIKGNKRLTSEQNKEYNFKLQKYNKCISLLESGHVNLYNNILEPQDVEDFGIDTLLKGIDKHTRIFRIIPIQSKEIHISYYGDKLVVSEFDIEKEIKTTDELFDSIINNYEYFNLEEKLFQTGTYKDYKDKIYNIFKKFYEAKGNGFLSDLISDKSSFRDNKYAHDFAKELMDAGYIKLLYDISTWIDTYVERLLRLEWTDFALDVVKILFENKNESVLYNIRNNGFIKRQLNNLSYDTNAKQITELLGLKPDSVILKVTEYIHGTDFASVTNVEKKEFKTMNELKTYLITDYHVPFDVVAEKNDNYIEYDNYLFEFFQ